MDDDTVSHVLNARDPYILLSLPPDASSESIKASYKRLALLLHPDKNKNPRAAEAFTAVAAAVSTLLQKSPANTNHDANWWQAFAGRPSSEHKAPAASQRDPLHQRQPWSNEKRPTPPTVTAQCPPAWRPAAHPTPPVHATAPPASNTWQRPGAAPWQAPSLQAVTALKEPVQQQAAHKPSKRPRPRPPPVVVVNDSDDSDDVPSPHRRGTKHKSRKCGVKGSKKNTAPAVQPSTAVQQVAAVPNVQALTAGFAHLAAQQRRVRSQGTLNAWLHPSERGVQGLDASVTTSSKEEEDERFGDEGVVDQHSSESRDDESDTNSSRSDTVSSSPSDCETDIQAPTRAAAQPKEPPGDTHGNALLEEAHQAAHHQWRAATLRVAIALQRTQRLRKQAMQRAHGWGRKGRKKQGKK